MDNLTDRYHYDQPPPRMMCPPGWSYRAFVTPEGVALAADYWEENDEQEWARWLRMWLQLAPDGSSRRRNTQTVYGWGRNTGFAKRRRARIERIEARRNPTTDHGYGLNGIY